MRRISTLLALAAIALLAGAGTAAAGGFSTTALDPLSEQPVAGRTIEVGYTIKAHGVSPVETPGTGIAIVGGDGERLEFPGLPQGPTGHYVAPVRFPSSGTWSWEQVQGGYTMQELGAVEVASADPPAAAPDDAGSGSAGPGALSWALLAATLVVAGLLAAVALLPARPRAG